MIYDSLKHLEQYRGVHPGIYRALRLLRDTDFSKLGDERRQIDGEDLFFFIQSYETKPVNDTPEAAELLLRGAVYAGVYGLAACVSGTAELCVPESLRPARRAEKTRALR